LTPPAPQPCLPCLPPCDPWQSCCEYPADFTPSTVPYSAPYVHNDLSHCGRDADALAAVMNDDAEEMSYLEHAPAHWSHWKACRAALWTIYLAMCAELQKLRTSCLSGCR
jgi:hypothetical protein